MPEDYDGYVVMEACHRMRPGALVYSFTPAFTVWTMQSALFDSTFSVPHPINIALLKPGQSDRRLRFMPTHLEMVHVSDGDGTRKLIETPDIYMEGWVGSSNFLPIGREARARMYVARDGLTRLTRAYLQLIEGVPIADGGKVSIGAFWSRTYHLALLQEHPVSAVTAGCSSCSG